MIGIAKKQIVVMVKPMSKIVRRPNRLAKPREVIAIATLTHCTMMVFMNGLVDPAIWKKNVLSANYKALKR